MGKNKPPPRIIHCRSWEGPTGTLGSLGSARSSSSSVERFTLPWIRENSSQNHQILMDFQNWYYIFIGITRRRPFSHFQFGIIIGCNIPKCPNFQAIPSRKVRGLPLKIFKWMVLHQIKYVPFASICEFWILFIKNYKFTLQKKI